MEGRIKTVLTEKEQQEYIRLRNIEAIGKGMGKILPENQKQRLEEIERKLRGNDSNDARIDDTKGGELLQEKVTETKKNTGKNTKKNTEKNTEDLTKLRLRETLSKLREALSEKEDELKRAEDDYQVIARNISRMSLDVYNKTEELKKKRERSKHRGRRGIIKTQEQMQAELISLENEISAENKSISIVVDQKNKVENMMRDKLGEIIDIKEKIRVMEEKLEELGGK